MTFVLSADALSTVAVAANAHEPFNLASAFLAAARRETDAKLVAAWELVGAAMMGRFDPKALRDPYGPPASVAITATNAPELEPIVEAITMPAVRARLADLVWLRTRNPAMAHLAVSSYLAAAELAEDPKEWVSGAHYAERSARLGMQLGGSAANATIGYLRSVAEKYQHGEARFLTIEAVRVLDDLHQGEASELIPLVRNQAIAMTAAGHYFIARMAYEQMLVLGRRSQDPAVVREAQLSIARSYEAEAGQRANAGENGVAAGFYHQAIGAYQRAGKARAEIDAIRPRLETVEVKAVSELKRISSTFDATKLIAHAVKAVSGLPLPNALLAFVSIHPLCDYDELRKTVIDMAQQTPLMSMAASTILGARGRTVARQPGMTLDAGDENERAVTGRMLHHLLLTRRAMVAPAYIAPALHRLNMEHDITIEALHDLVGYSAFVPDDRREIFLRGLHAGFDGDFMTAVHFLIPQFENTLRLIFRAHGIATTIFKDSTERELDLNALLYDPRLEHILAKGIVFELQCFLVDQRAANFRNQMAHGMLADDAFTSTDALYIWWLILHLTIAFHPMATSAHTDDGAHSASDKAETPPGAPS